MKRTQHITLGLLAGMALAFTTSGCRKAERRDCVDETGRITYDQNCQMADQQRRTGGVGIRPYYHYVYSGSSGGHIGDQVFNGNPMPGMRSGSSSGFFGGVSRGGFGSTGSSGGHSSGAAS